jgi:hypothetical protein
LKADFPVVVLFEHPTVRSLARYLSGAPTASGSENQWRDLAQRQKQALARLKVKLNKSI